MLRELTTDFVGAAAWLRLGGGVAPPLARKIVDLGSGSGGPLLALQRVLERQHGLPGSVTLSDLHPERRAFERIRRLAPERVGLDCRGRGCAARAGWISVSARPALGSAPPRTPASKDAIASGRPGPGHPASDAGSGAPTHATP